MATQDAKVNVERQRASDGSRRNGASTKWVILNRDHCLGMRCTREQWAATVLGEEEGIERNALGVERRWVGGNHTRGTCVTPPC